MKALTLTQPWATLVAIGAKRIETRSRKTNYRGPIAIHAGNGLGPVGGRRGLAELCNSPPFARALAPIGFHVDRMPRGAIVAVGHLVGCESTEWLCENNGAYKILGGHRRHWALTEQESAFGDFSPGRFGWLLLDVKPLAEPIPAKGALGLWEWHPPEGWNDAQ